MADEALEENRRNLVKALGVPEDATGAAIVQKLINTSGHILTLTDLIALAHVCDLDLQVYVVDRASDVVPQKL